MCLKTKTLFSYEKIISFIADTHSLGLCLFSFNVSSSSLWVSALSVSLADSQAWKLLSRWQHKLFDFWLSLFPFFSAAPLLPAKVRYLWPAGFSDKTRIFFPWSKLCDYWYHFSINLRCFLMKVLKQIVRIYSFPSKRRGQILFLKPIIMYSFLSS